jgi:hypothetical protein
MVSSKPLLDEAREELVSTKPTDTVAGGRDADADVVAAAAAAVEAEAAAASDADAQAAMKSGAVAAAALESTSAWAMQDESPPLDFGKSWDDGPIALDPSAVPSALDPSAVPSAMPSWDDGPIALVATVRGYGVAAGLEGLQAHPSPRAQRAAVPAADTLEPLLGSEPEDDQRPPAARAHKHWNAALAPAADLPHTASTRLPLQSPLPRFGFPSSAALVTTVHPASNAFSCAVGERLLSGLTASAIQAAVVVSQHAELEISPRDAISTAVVVSQHAATPTVAPTSTADVQYGAHLGIGRKRAAEEPSAAPSAAPSDVPSDVPNAVPSAEPSAERSAEPSAFSTASAKAPRLLSGFRGSGERRGGA